MRSIFLAATLMFTVAPINAQPSDTAGWRWIVTSNVFAGVNYQHRRFDDVRALESQNWFMGQAERPVGRGQLSIHTMISLEPFTLDEPGSPQVFQTGESFNGLPLIDYQHPHDLFSTLSASYVRPVGAWAIRTSAAIVGAPALGPPAFMHRPSAAENPQSPLVHHHLDSMHITPGVITVGLQRAAFGVDSSLFRGREPDEQRTDIDFGPLNSWSIRGTWASGP